jgi:hypothetical protein
MASHASMSQSYRTAPARPGHLPLQRRPAPYPDRVVPGTTERRFLSLADSAGARPLTLQRGGLGTVRRRGAGWSLVGGGERSVADLADRVV